MNIIALLSWNKSIHTLNGVLFLCQWMCQDRENSNNNNHSVRPLTKKKRKGICSADYCAYQSDASMYIFPVTKESFRIFGTAFVYPEWIISVTNVIPEFEVH